MATYVCRNCMDRWYADPEKQHQTDMLRLEETGCTPNVLEFVEALCRTIGAGKMSAFGTLCDSLTHYDASLRVDDQMQQNLRAALPLLVSADKPKTVKDLAVEAMSHLSCGNYSQQNDCVAASFAVLLNMMQKPLQPDHVRDVISENIDCYMQHHMVFMPLAPFPGLCNPLGVMRSDTVVSMGALRVERWNPGWGDAEEAMWSQYLREIGPQFPLTEIEDEKFVQESELREAPVERVEWIVKQFALGGLQRGNATTYYALIATSKGSGFLTASNLDVMRRCLDNGTAAHIHGSPGS
eukprot:1892491-Rhodomonas_salina.1